MNRKQDYALRKRTVITAGINTYLMNLGSYEHNLMCSVNKHLRHFTREMTAIGIFGLSIKFLTLQGSSKRRCYHFILQSYVTVADRAQGWELSGHMTICDDLSGAHPLPVPLMRMSPPPVFPQPHHHCDYALWSQWLPATSAYWAHLYRKKSGMPATGT